MDATARQELEMKALSGDRAAHLALAAELESAGENELALQWLRRACAMGGTTPPREARSALARHLLANPMGQPDEAVLAAVSAAADGDPEAAHLTAMLAGGTIGMRQSWPTALTYMQRAAELGHDVARRALILLASDRSLAGRAAAEPSPPAEIWRQLRDSIDVAAQLRAPRPRVHSVAPRIALVEKFASAELCDWFIARAQGRLKPADIFDRVSGDLVYHERRTNSAAYNTIPQFDLPLLFVRARIAAVTGIPATSMEAPAVLHYLPGQEFGSHYDFFEPGTPGYEKRTAEEGQRVVTFLLYLNDGYEGGETEFPNIGWRHKGKKGDAMFFWNVQPDGTPDKRTLHAGTPPTSGEKYVLSQWIRAHFRAPQQA
jgi:prolyl 4-hydroxylase